MSSQAQKVGAYMETPYSTSSDEELDFDKKTGKLVVVKKGQGGDRQTMTVMAADGFFTGSVLADKT